MDNNGKGVYANSFKEQLTFRGIVLGMIGSLIITTSSMYVALRMGALPWPTLFVAIMSMTILKVLKNTNLNEINVTHTIMSAGAMVAGGFAFTIPGIWMIDKNADVSFMTLLAVTLSGTILGIIFTALIRTYFIEKEALPFPMGIAAYETVIAGDEGGSKSKVLFSTLAGSAIFTALRDWAGMIPSAINFNFLATKNIFAGVWMSPMAVGIGYIIGPIFTGVMFLGALISYLIIIPVGIKIGIFPDVAIATAFKDSLGIGIMVGTGIGVLIKGILPRAKELYGPMLNGTAAKDGDINIKIIPVAFALVAFILTVIGKVGFIASLLVIVGTWLTTAMAASMTGQSGINPMEIFAIIVLIVVKAIVPLGMIPAFLVAGTVAIACGLAGDVLNDFKSGYLLNTSPRAQIIGETIGAITGAIVSVIVLFVMIKAFGQMGPGTELVAPQAYAVSTMVGGLPNTPAFISGLVIGIVLYLFKIPSTLGLGIYLPMMITSAIALGGLASYIVSKVKPDAAEKGTIVSSGLLGGEGVTGVVIAIIKVLTMS